MIDKDHMRILYHLVHYAGLKVSFGSLTWTCWCICHQSQIFGWYFNAHLSCSWWVIFCNHTIKL